MPRIVGFTATALLFISLAAAPADVSAHTIDDPGDRSDTADVRTSGIPGVDQYSIMQVGPSATDWMGLSRSSAYWIGDGTDRSGGYRAQNIGAYGTASASGSNWGWLGLLGLGGLRGLFNKSRMR